MIDDDPKAYRKAKAYVCPVCVKEEEGYYGRLVFPGEGIPFCPHHKKVELLPSGDVISPLRGLTART